MARSFNSARAKRPAIHVQHYVLSTLHEGLEATVPLLVSQIEAKTQSGFPQGNPTFAGFCLVVLCLTEPYCGVGSKNALPLG
ncbi:MAG: hypothetical protein V7K67_20175 [Nostoc sp.]